MDSAHRQLDWVVVGAALVSFAILMALGAWQMERMAWKQQLIETIQARVTAEPVGIEEALERAEEGTAEYLRVRLRGRFLHEREMRLFAVEDGQPGWHVVTPLALADGSNVLVNRGYVPYDLEEPSTRPQSQPQGAVEIVGLARVPEEPGLFTPDHDRARNRWFWRDVRGMALAASLPGNTVNRFLIEQEATTSPTGWPRPGVTRLELPNRHFEYALTWFGLAATLLAVTLVFLRSRSR